MNRDLPVGWAWARFDEVAQVAANLVDPSGFPRSFHIAPNHIEGRTGRLLQYRTVAEDGVTSAKHRFRSGQILYSKIRPYLAKAVRVDFDGLCSADMYPVDTYLHPQYLLYWLLTDEFTASSAGQQGRSLLPKINQRQLGALPVPIAPLAEQRRVAELLDEQFDLLHRTTAEVDRLLARIRRAQRHIIQLACLGQLRAAGSGRGNAAKELADALGGASPVPQEEVPDLPAGWTWATLAGVADVVGGVTKDSKKQEGQHFVEVPYLRVANVQEGHLALDSVTTIRVPAAKAESLRLVPGDVLMNEGGDRDKLGRGWVWEGQIRDCIHQNHVFRARVRADVLHPKLLSWHGNTFGRAWFEAHGKQSTNLASISLTNVKRLPVPVPPRDEQQLIVDMVERYVTLLDRAAGGLQELRVRCEHLRRSVLRAAFSGGLTSQDPSEEPADIFLKQLREASGAANGEAVVKRRKIQKAPSPRAATSEESSK